MEKAISKPKNVVGRKKLGELLIEGGFLSAHQLNRALQEQKKSRKRLGETLIELKMISEEQLAQTLAPLIGMRYIRPTSMEVDPEIFMLIPEQLARRHLAVPLKIDNKELMVAMVDPLDYESINDLRFHAGMAIHPLVATRKEVLATIEDSYRIDMSVEKIVQASAKDFDTGSVEVIPELAEADLLNAETRSLEERSRLAPVIQLVNLILSKAIKMRASDIHIEPGQKECKVRFRIDGLLKDDMRLPKWVQSPLVSRIKILAKLDISERRLPQDGAVRVYAQNRKVDLRVSALPTHHGEKMVLRILDQSKLVIEIEKVGFLEKDVQAVRRMVKKKKGMILVTGPTGSGKTTTLYAIINELRSEVSNLTTVEDPVEYTIEGVNQVQINPDIGLTFASALRSILRQDPNIIFVGEIRDLETAEIAFRAAMTGHLVLSTIHTNDATATITRLIDIGIPRYLVSSAVIGIIGQRLIRKLCLRCKVELPQSDLPSPPPSLEDHSHSSGVFPVGPAKQGEGCNACNYSGFSGRVGIFEILTLSSKVKELISSGVTDQELRSAGVVLGMTSMEEDGIEKVKAGITVMDEVLRVVDSEEVFKSICSKCDRPIRVDFLVCPHCESPSPYVCSSCGKLTQPEWRVCPYCRHKESSP
ncbi:MAG: ATPase, T2SS/T4P/T4SS family [Nitrospira sp.]|nr:type II secretion system protein GspE [Candidatus Manganitrophaceae bacterium]HIL35345.1 type II secretion system protein GspE [Candidatus Manganitrophaceae bacterium]